MLKLYSKESIADVKSRIEEGRVCKIDINKDGGIVIEDAPDNVAVVVQPYIDKEIQKRTEALKVINNFEEHMEDETVKAFTFHYDSTKCFVSLSYATNFDSHKEKPAEQPKETAAAQVAQETEVDPVSVLEELKELFADNDPKTGLFSKLMGEGKKRRYQEQTVRQLIDIVKYYVESFKEKE